MCNNCIIVVYYIWDYIKIFPYNIFVELVFILAYAFCAQAIENIHLHGISWKIWKMISLPILERAVRLDQRIFLRPTEEAVTWRDVDNTHKHTMKLPTGWKTNAENLRLKCSDSDWLLNEMIMNNWFASVYRVLTNQRKRLFSPTNRRFPIFVSLSDWLTALYSFVEIG